MVKLTVELYKGPIDKAFKDLPGYTTNPLQPEEFWTVVIPKPKPGSPQETFLRPVPADAAWPIATMGTETLPENVTSFNVKQVCIKGYKYNPFFYYPKTPTGTLLGPIPDPPPGLENQKPYYCLKVTPPAKGIGIWIVSLKLDMSTKLPFAPPGRNAVFEPADSVPGVRQNAKQPYLILNDEPRPRYIAFYDCTGWDSRVEIMNAQSEPGKCYIHAYSRSGEHYWSDTIKLAPHETVKVPLDAHVPRYEGKVVVEPFIDGWEFPSTLVMRTRVFRQGVDQFIPFTRVP
jgi:hypothetical protein